MNQRLRTSFTVSELHVSVSLTCLFETYLIVHTCAYVSVYLLFVPFHLPDVPVVVSRIIWVVMAV